MSERTLISIAPSHYCEKARWALDRAGLEYTEENYAPLFHLTRTVPLGTRTTPALITPHGVIKDSTEILHLVDSWGEPKDRLFPTDDAQRKEVDEWEELFDKKLGWAARKVAYHYVIDTPELFKAINETKLSPMQRKLFRASAGLIRPAVRKALRLDAESKVRADATLEEVLTKVESALADGRTFLVGDRFTAADLTFAALLSPLLASEKLRELRGIEMAPGLVPAGLAKTIQEIRTRPAGAYALRMINDYRSAKVHSVGK